MKIKVPLSLGTVLIFLAVSAVADIPHVISYQGHLIDSLGIPLDGEFQMTFTIYDQPELGNVLWTSGPRTVPVNGGLFTCDLGMVTAIPDSVFHQHFERWLGISVDGGPELTPRTIFNSVAFSYRAQFADNAGFTESAGHADHATTADDATDAGHAMYADTADYAHTAPGGGGAWVDGGTKVYLADSTDYVGIGTTNPTAELEVYSSGEPDLLLTRRSIATAALLGFRTGGGVPDWSIYTPSGGDALYIDKHDFENVISCLQNGNVGIGIMTPSSKLTVDSGNIQIRGLQRWTGAGDSAKLILGDNNHGLASVYGQGLTFWTYGDGKHDMRFGAHDGTINMLISASGQVSVNSENPPQDARLYAWQISDIDRAAVQGDCGVMPPMSTGGGVGVKGTFASDGVFGVGVLGDADTWNDLGDAVGVYGRTGDAGGYGVYYEGGLGGTGKVASIVETKSYGHRELYGMHSTGS